MLVAAEDECRVLLQTHLNNIEARLLQYYEHTSLLAASANMGPLREAFVKSFLSKHLAENAKIGSGEIFDRNSTDDYQSRNQQDLVIYDPSFPKLDFDVLDIRLFLAESVFSTIEVKSTLSKDELSRACISASKTKKLVRNLQRRAPTANLTFPNSGSWWPLGITNFVVAYNGPTISTVHSWLAEIHKDAKIDYPEVFKSDRDKLPAPSVDGIFILGKGFLVYNNNPLFVIENAEETPNTNRWMMSDQSTGNLQFLFWLITHVTSGLDISPYLTAKIPAVLCP